MVCFPLQPMWDFTNNFINNTFTNTYEFVLKVQFFLFYAYHVKEFDEKTTIIYLSKISP